MLTWMDMEADKVIFRHIYDHEDKFKLFWISYSGHTLHQFHSVKYKLFVYIFEGYFRK